MVDVIAPYVPVAEMLDSLGIGLCAFDDEDRTLLWNRSFLRLFPEHDGHVHVGEAYSANLRRFYMNRLDAAEMQHIDRYIADGVTRHRRQFQPFEFCHLGQWVRVASLPVAGMGRLRIWTPIPPPRDGDVLAQGMAKGGKGPALPVIDEIADGLMLRDTQGRIVRVNRRFAQMYGLDAEAQAVNNSFEDILSALWSGRPEASEAILAMADNARFAGAPFELPLPDDRWVRVREHRGSDGTGISTHVDITDLHRLQRSTEAAQAKAEALAASLHEQIEERRRAEAALQQAQRVEAVGQLTGGVAHDFNNLLSVMLGNVELLEQDETDLRRRRRLEVVRAAVERGRALTGQLLAFARRQPLQPRPVVLADMVTDMLPLLRSACGGQIQVQVEIPEGTPAALVDPTQLELVILNLAINARDAMPKGGTLRITAGAEVLSECHDPEAPSPGVYVVLSVSDTGTGMTEAVRVRAVEPFFTTKAPGAGSGLGLSQAYGVARQSGGTVRIESTLGRGTRVMVLLPAVEGRVPEPVRAAPVPMPARSRLLLVDDEPSVLESFAEIMRRMGHQVSTASGAAQARLALDGGLQIDALVTDVMMPEMNGMELARWVRERRAGLPVLFISGFVAPEAVAELGANCLLLRKPCRANELRSALAALLGQGVPPDGAARDTSRS